MVQHWLTNLPTYLRSLGETKTAGAYTSSQANAMGKHMKVPQPTMAGTPQSTYTAKDRSCSRGADKKSMAVLKGSVLRDIIEKRSMNWKNSSSSSYCRAFTWSSNWFPQALSSVQKHSTALLQCSGCSSSQCRGWKRHI